MGPLLADSCERGYYEYNDEENIAFFRQGENDIEDVAVPLILHDKA